MIENYFPFNLKYILKLCSSVDKHSKYYTLFFTGLLSLYIDGCLFETAESSDQNRGQNLRDTVIGKSASANRHYAGIMFDQFTFWEKVLNEKEVMSVYLHDRKWRTYLKV